MTKVSSVIDASARWRSRWAIGLVALVLVSACSAGSSGSVVTDASSPSKPTEVGSSEPTTTSPETTSVAPQTSLVETTMVPDEGVNLSDLPGSIAVATFGCGDGFSVPSPDPADTYEICLIDPDGGDVVAVPVPDSYIDYLSWSWDGGYLVFDGEEKAWLVEADGTGLAERNYWGSPTMGESPDGRFRVTPRQVEPGFWLSPIGATRENPQWSRIVFDDDACCLVTRWSPDGTRLVYGTGVDGCQSLAVLDVESGDTRLLTGPGSSFGSVCLYPDSARWSPDGTEILFMDEGPDQMQSTPTVVRADGSGLRPLVADTAILPTGSYIANFDWSPDGSAVVLGLAHDLGAGLYVVNRDGTAIEQIPNVPLGATVGWSLAWSYGQ